MPMEDPCPGQIKEAQRLRNLGRYGEASQLFQKLQETHDDLSVSTEYASMLLSQGCPQRCLEELDNAIKKFATTSDDVVVAVAELLRSTSTIATTVQFRPQLEAAVGLYNQYLLKRPVEEYDKKMVIMLLLYLGIRRLAETVGVDVSSAPTPSSSLLKSIYDYLVCNKRFPQAFSIAKEYALMVSLGAKASLLEALSHHDGPSDLTKAEVLTELSSVYSQVHRPKDATSSLQNAIKLFQDVGHATAPLVLQAQECSLELEEPDSRMSASHRQRLRKTLLHIGSELESRGAFNEIRPTFLALYEIAGIENDDQLRIECDHDTERLSGITGNNLNSILTRLLMFQSWSSIGPVTGRMLHSLKALHLQVEQMEAPAIRSSIIHMLCESYKTLGDVENTRYWTEKQHGDLNSLPKYSRFLHGTDKFYKELEGTTVVSQDAKDELEKLHLELDRIIEDLNVDTIPASNLHFGIMKVLNMCEFYVTQFRLRGFDRTKSLVESCLAYSDRLIQILPESNRKLWQGKASQTRARFLFTQSNICGKPDPKNTQNTIPDAEILSKAIEAFEQTAQTYKKGGLTYHFATVRGMIATCYQQMWTLENNSPTSLHFGRAVKDYEVAGSIFAKLGVIAPLQLNRSNLLRHLFIGYLKKVHYGRPRSLWRYLGLSWISELYQQVEGSKWLRIPRWLRQRESFFFTSPYEETVRSLSQVEKLIEQKRQDLSALKSQAALLAKQNMRRDKNVSSVYQTAPMLFGVAGEKKLLWEWTQRSKARSVSDLLGLGINIPMELKRRIEADPIAADLWAEEERLTRLIDDPTTANQLLARKEAEIHRQAMRKNDNLRELLELREGHPVTWKQLRDLRNITGVQKRTWFIDWLVVGELILIMAVSDEVEVYHVFEIDLKDMDSTKARKWVEQNLSQEKPLNKDAGESLTALEELLKLVAPIINITDEGDLLVLCMSEILHDIPVHAAIIKGKFSEQDDSRALDTLIERNPIIYTSSMTVFEQNTRQALENARARATEENRQPYTGTVLGVYEEDGELNWEVERDNVYETCKELAENMQWGEVHCGVEVDRARFQKACQSDVVHFSGHFHYTEENMLKNGIILGAPIVGQSEHLTTATEEVSKKRVIKPERIFSVSNTFEFEQKIRASLISLFACASSSEKIQQGDEPLGMVTALLYAGATSVAGTLWPVSSFAGRVFSQHFYKTLAIKQDSGGTIDLAIAMQNVIRKIRKDWNDDEMEQPYCWAGFVLHGSRFIYTPPQNTEVGIENKSVNGMES